VNVTDEAVEAAAEKLFGLLGPVPSGDWSQYPERVKGHWRDDARAVLLAAAPAMLAAERERIAELEAKLAMPCGSCHACENWADETWRRAGRKPPHVHEWDGAKAALAKVLALCDEAERMAAVAVRGTDTEGVGFHASVSSFDVREALES
jgi:hypothetical protein